MKPITQEWISKAEGDFVTAQRELQAEVQPNYDAACFHCQQCIEKYLKACLQEAEIPFDKTHDLVLLLALCLPIKPDWDSFRTTASDLTTYSVKFRYPGESATKQDALKAFSDCSSIRQLLKTHLHN